MVTSSKTCRKGLKVDSPAKQAKSQQVKHLGIVKRDGYLAPFEDAIRGRHEHAQWKYSQYTDNGKSTLSDFANGHEYYGLHKLEKGWVFREWAPNATDIYLIGDFNKWKESPKYRCKRIKGTGNWELKLSENSINHGDLYKMHVYWEGGEGERDREWAGRGKREDLGGRRTTQK